MDVNEPPSQLDGAEVLLYCHLDERVRPTGVHFIVLEDGTKYVPTNAAICRYSDGGGIYRFYCNDAWEVITDTVHTSVQEAIESIENSYRGAAAVLCKPH